MAEELNGQEKQILIIHSFQENNPWTREMNKAIEDRLQSEEIQTNVFSYYMDSKRVTDEKSRLSMLRAALKRYEKEDLDLIFICDDYAFQAYLQSGSKLSKKIPTVFCSVDMFDPSSIVSFKNITGITESVGFAETYDLGMKLFPATQQVVVITDNTPIGHCMKDWAASQLQNKIDTADIIFLDGRYYDTPMLLVALNNLPPNAIILMSVWSVDASGTYRNTSDYYPLMSGSANAPILVIDDVGFGEGVFGGYVSAPYDIAEMAADMGTAILKGTPVSEIPVNLGGAGKLKLDWNQLARWDVNLSLLPAGAVIVNKPESFIDRYLDYIIIVTIVFGVLFLSLGFVTLYHLKYRSAVKSALKLKEDNDILAERYRHVFNNHFKGMFLFSISDNKIVEVNEYMSEILGYSREELANIHPSRFSSAFNESGINTRDLPGIYDVSITKKNGEKVYANATRIYFSENNKEYIYIIYIDRTEIRQKEEQLEKQKEELHITLKSIEEGVVSTDKDKKILNINQAALTFLGLEEPPTRYLGKDIDEVFVILDHCEFRRMATLIDEAYEAGESVSIPEKTLIIKGKNKNRIYISGNVSNMFDKNGFYGSVISFKDVTEIHTQTEYMELALQSSNVFRWFYDIEDKSFSFGYEFRKMNNQINDPDKKLTLDQLFELVHPDDLHLIEEGFNDTIHDVETSFSIQVRINFFNDGYKWWELRCNTLSGNKRLLGICLNINSIKQAETELVNARNQAMQSDKLKSAFLANMSHEIRTPLNGIVGFANLLTCDEDYTDEEKKVFISTIENNCHILLALISDILDLSRIESGTLSFHMQNCPVNELIESVVETHRVNLSGRVRLEAELQDDEIVIVSDRIRLGQLLTNLLTNAVKFTHEGVITVGYEVVEDKDINFYVQDTGCGISEEDVEKIFGRFYKIDEFAQGAGLGLSICKVITERFGGSIKVDSQLGKGTRFTISMPYIPAGESPVLGLLVGELPNDEKRKPESTILVAEDEDQSFELIDAVLSSRYHIIRAYDGEDVVGKFRPGEIDLILMDVKMPNKSGIDALREIRAISRQVPVIMQTAYAYEADKVIAEEAGCNDFMTKPLDTALLLELIEKYVVSN